MPASFPGSFYSKERLEQIEPLSDIAHIMNFYCEDMVVRMYIDDLDEAHREALTLTVRKFKLHPQRLP